VNIKRAATDSPSPLSAVLSAIVSSKAEGSADADGGEVLFFARREAREGGAPGAPDEGSGQDEPLLRALHSAVRLASGCGRLRWAFPQPKQDLKKSPKSRLTKIRNYDLISYVSQQNSYQGRPGDAAGAGAGGMGNSPRAACAQSFASLSFMSHQYPPANPASSLKKPGKNSLFGAVPVKVNEGQ